MAIIFIRIFGPFLYVGEIFCMEQEAHNTADCFAVAIVKDETVVESKLTMFLVKLRALFGTSLSTMEL